MQKPGFICLTSRRLHHFLTFTQFQLWIWSWTWTCQGFLPYTLTMDELTTHYHCWLTFRKPPHANSCVRFRPQMLPTHAPTFTTAAPLCSTMAMSTVKYEGLLYVPHRTTSTSTLVAMTSPTYGIASLTFSTLLGSLTHELPHTSQVIESYFHY